MKNNITSKFVFSLAMLSMAAAHADVQLQYVDTSEAVTVIQIAGDTVRMDRSGEPTYMLYQHKKQQLSMIDPRRNEGQLLTPDTIETLAAHTQSIRAALVARMATLNERQQQLLRQQLGDMASILDGQRNYSVQRVGNGEVAGIGCQQVELQINAKPHYNYCVAAAKNVGLSEQESAALKGLVAMMAGLAAQMGGGDNPLSLVPLDTLGGIPLEMKAVDGADLSRLQAVKKDKIAGEQMQLPKAVKLQPLAPKQ